MTEADIRAQWTARQIELLGLNPGDKKYPEALQAAERGWAAWRIARELGMDPATVEHLGGPARTG